MKSNVNIIDTPDQSVSGLLLVTSDPFLQSDPVLNLILTGSIISIGLAAVLGVVLIVLARRAKKSKPSVEAKTQLEVETAPVQNDALEDTVASILSADSNKNDTHPVAPQIITVGEPNVLPVSGQRPVDIGWQIASLTDVGLKREINEDNMLMLESESTELGPYGVYVVADGLGGHVAGEIASQLAVEAIEQRHNSLPPSSQQDSFETWLRDTALAANEAILKRQEEEEEVKKMGSTIVMTLVTDHTAHIVNVGDSRAYRLNQEKIEQISTDHSLVERLVQIGQITREEARTHKQRNVIYSTLGEKRQMEMGYYEASLEPGDRLLLCSDGLSEKVPDEEILRISHEESDPATTTQLLVEAAKQAGGDDNITVIIVQMNEAPVGEETAISQGTSASDETAISQGIATSHETSDDDETSVSQKAPINQEAPVGDETQADEEITVIKKQKDDV